MIVETLALYGAALSPGGSIVSPSGRDTGARPIIKGKRLRIESGAGALLFSGPVTPAALCDFVEKFWFWRKV